LAMLESKSGPAESQSRPRIFDWSGTKFVLHVVAVRGVSEQEALAEAERAIGAAEVPHQIGYKGEAEPHGTQGGDAGYFRSNIELRLIGSEVQIRPKRGAWITAAENFELWVPSRVVQERYRRKKRSPDQEHVLEAARALWPYGWDAMEFRDIEKPLVAKMTALGFKVPKPDTMRRALGFKK